VSTTKKNQRDNPPTHASPSPDPTSESPEKSRTSKYVDAEMVGSATRARVTFGTKKAKPSIKVQERNRADVSAMEGVVGNLQDRIEAIVSDDG
jgi:A49-like RNA polymerase I associated factor